MKAMVMVVVFMEAAFTEALSCAVIRDLPTLLHLVIKKPMKGWLIPIFLNQETESLKI